MVSMTGDQDDLMVATREPDRDAADASAFVFDPPIDGVERLRRRRPSQLRAQWKGDVSLYDRMGGAIGLRRVVNRFRTLAETLPEAADLRAVLLGGPSDLGPKLYEFLSGWTGGPDLYTMRHGAPKLRRRHFLVNVGPAQRDAWLLCFRRAMEETVGDRRAIDELWPQVESLAHYLCNRA